MKYLCKLTKTVWESDEFGDEWKEKTHEFKEMTVDEINTFIKKYPNIKLKILIPTKTSNPSEEKGSTANLVKQFCKEKQYYDDGKKVLEQFAEWAKANGETPEVDNPVPSIDNNDINWLIELSANWINKNYSKADGKRFELIKSKLQNGRETE